MITPIIVSTLIVIVGMFATTCVIYGATLYFKSRIEHNKVINQLEAKTDRINYSQAVLKYIKEIAANLIVLRFQEFLDGYHLEKITRERFKNILTPIIQEIYKSIKIDEFDFNLLMYDKEFIEKYLIQTCIAMTKKMLEKALIEFED